ncbi:hypothetical protein L3Q72_08425 [Vibrio sp. JC009]|uniref:tetratricopeptide repeat protein n=1 Tax=Vibrio sp. JC009 TaxID=2912314 RepID=UPI0023AE8BE5|nr:papain-like cysteine protease family protein [Vibrio sp. JC009]WED20673.1 hypothetical protein L3Q72_08425 [Vibrio sp. JC009]
MTPAQNERERSLEKIKRLVDKGRYLDAYHSATELWGDYRSWTDKERLNQLGRIFRGLGRIRLADWVNLRIYRKWPQDSLAAIHQILHSTSSCGAIECYEKAEQWLKKVSSSEGDIADWFIVKAIILLNVRDFTQAHQYLDKAAKVKSSENWANRVRANVLEAEGRREEALNIACRSYAVTKGPVELERYTELLKVTTGAQAALNFLLQRVNQYQSVSLWRRVAGYQFELGEYDAALESNAQGEKLQIFGTDKYDEFSDSLRYQIALEKRDLTAAKNQLVTLKSEYFREQARQLEKHKELKPVLKLPVPHITQKHMTCAPSCMASIAQYWGIHADEDKIAALICFDGTDDRLQREWLAGNDFIYLDFDLSAQAAGELLSRKIPFTLVTTSGLSSHLQVVKGIDNEAGILYLMDPSLSAESKALIDGTCSKDLANGPKCRAVVPEEKAHLLQGLSLPSMDLYPIKNQFDAQANRGDIYACRQLISEISQIDSDHRLALYMKRSLAILLNDESAIARYTNQLLERYPDSVSLLLSRYYSLKTTKGHADAYQWLKEKYSKYRELDLLNMLLEDIQLSQDIGKTKRELLARKAMWSNPKFFWLEGHDAWARSDKESASLYYYWALCLEPGNPGYLRSYFLTYLDQGKAEQALSTIKAIYDSSVHINPGVAYSLYRAYCFRGQEHLGLDVLQDVCELHPDDSALIAFYLQELSDKGQWQRFEQAYEKYALSLPGIEQKKLTALYYLDKGDNLAAVHEYEALQTQIPGNLQISERLIDAYKRAGLNKQLESFLERLIDQLGERPSVLNLVLESTKDEAKRIGTLKRLVELFPADFDAQRALACHYLISDNLTGAQQISEQLNQIEPGYVENLLLQAEILLAKGKQTQARAVACDAIKLSPNHSGAFQMLMRTHIQPDEKKQALKEFARQLASIPNADDGVWNFWHTARYWFTNQELREFCDQMIARHGDNWCVWVVSAYQKEIANELDDAISELDKAAEIAPLTARVFVEKARMMSVQGRKQEAAEAFGYAATLAPGWDYIAIEHYKHCERYADIKTGLAILEQCKRFNDRDAVLRGYMAECYYNLGRTERALELLVEAIERMFDYSWAWEKLQHWGDESGSSQLWKEMLNKRQSQLPDSVDTWIISAQLSSDNSERCRYLSRAIEIEPTHIEANKEMVDVLVAMQKEQQALELIRNNKWNRSAPISIAVKECHILHRLGETESAIAQLEILLQKSPRYIEGWLLLLSWVSGAEDKNKAQFCAAQLEAVGGNDAECLCEIGAYYERYGNPEQKSRVLSLYERAHVLSPESGNAAFSLLDRLIFEKHSDRAWRLLSKMESSFETPWVDVRRIELLIREGAIEKALALYRKIVASGENTAWLYYHPLEMVSSTDSSLLPPFVDALQEAVSENRDTPQMAEVLVRYAIKG